MTEQLLKLEEVTDRLKVSMSTVRRLIDRGDLVAVRIGRNLRVRPADLEAYVEKHRGE